MIPVMLFDFSKDDGINFEQVCIIVYLVMEVF